MKKGIHLSKKAFTYNKLQQKKVHKIPSSIITLFKNQKSISTALFVIENPKIRVKSPVESTLEYMIKGE